VSAKSTERDENCGSEITPGFTLRVYSKATFLKFFTNTIDYLRFVGKHRHARLIIIGTFLEVRFTKVVVFHKIAKLHGLFYGVITPHRVQDLPSNSFGLFPSSRKQGLAWFTASCWRTEKGSQILFYPHKSV